MLGTTFVGLDPERLDDLASELRTQSTVLDETHRNARTALALADLTDPNLLRRLADRADLCIQIAAELNQRAQMIRNFSVDFPSQAAAEAARTQILAGLESFDTIDELQDKIDNWSGSDNDPILDNLIHRLHEARTDDDNYRALWARWAAEQIALADAELAADQALVEVRALLRIDNQSGWTPWHDGDAEVTPDDAAAAMTILAALDSIAVAMVVDQLTQTELERLADGLAGTATHADKPWGHWAWSPIQAPVRETNHWFRETADAGTHLYAGIAEGFYAMGTQQGGPSEYNPHTAQHIEDHFTESHRIVVEGSIPLLSNGARCVEGDGWSCVGLGAEVALWVAGEMVGGVIVATIATTPAITLVRVRLRDGTERVATIINQHTRPTAADIPTPDPNTPKPDFANWGAEFVEQPFRADGSEYLTNLGGISSNPLDHQLPARFPQIPADASVRALTPDPATTTYGVEFKFPHPETGQTVKIRIHGPDASAPPGSNAATGEVLRVTVGSRQLDADGVAHPRGIYNPDSEFFSEEIINDVHIPWPVTE